MAGLLENLFSGRDNSGGLIEAAPRLLSAAVPPLEQQQQLQQQQHQGHYQHGYHQLLWQHHQQQQQQQEYQSYYEQWQYQQQLLQQQAPRQHQQYQQQQQHRQHHERLPQEQPPQHQHEQQQQQQQLRQRRDQQQQPRQHERPQEVRPSQHQHERRQRHHQDLQRPNRHRRMCLRRRPYNRETKKYEQWRDCDDVEPLVVNTTTTTTPATAATKGTTTTTGQQQEEEQQQRQQQSSVRMYTIHLPLGGTIRVYEQLLSIERQEALTTEVVDCNLMRQYIIQGTTEPRAHFLLHPEATDDFDDAPQPGYRYGQITMKAHPLSTCPEMGALSRDLLQLLRGNGGTREFRIGVNPVFYRDGNDHMGYHADDDQGESVIVTALVTSPPVPRRIHIKPLFRPDGTPTDDEALDEFELVLRAGDVYEMDGTMQLHYVHGVPKDKSQTGSADYARIAIVFRDGDKVAYDADNGTRLEDLSPRNCDIVYRFGNPFADLVEGRVYSRAQLRNMGAHWSPQRGISGRATLGADAIIISGMRRDGLVGKDSFGKVDYFADTKVGGISLLTTMKLGKVTRVFRSSVLSGPYTALDPEVEVDITIDNHHDNNQDGKNADKKSTTKHSTSAVYRYDGLYRIQLVNYMDEKTGDVVFETPETLTAAVVGRLYQFEFERVGVGEGRASNRKSNQEMLDRCRNTYMTMPPEPRTMAFSRRKSCLELLGPRTPPAKRKQQQRCNTQKKKKARRNRPGNKSDNDAAATLMKLAAPAPTTLPTARGDEGKDDRNHSSIIQHSPATEEFGTLGRDHGLVGPTLCTVKECQDIVGKTIPGCVFGVKQTTSPRLCSESEGDDETAKTSACVAQKASPSLNQASPSSSPQAQIVGLPENSMADTEMSRVVSKDHMPRNDTARPVASDAFQRETTVTTSSSLMAWTVSPPSIITLNSTSPENLLTPRLCSETEEYGENGESDSPLAKVTQPVEKITRLLESCPQPMSNLKKSLTVSTSPKPRCRKARAFATSDNSSLTALTAGRSNILAKDHKAPETSSYRDKIATTMSRHMRAYPWRATKVKAAQEDQDTCEMPITKETETNREEKRRQRSEKALTPIASPATPTKTAVASRTTKADRKRKVFNAATAKSGAGLRRSPRKKTVAPRRLEQAVVARRQQNGSRRRAPESRVGTSRAVAVGQKSRKNEAEKVTANSPTSMNHAPEVMRTAERPTGRDKLGSADIRTEEGEAASSGEQSTRAVNSSAVQCCPETSLHGNGSEERNCSEHPAIAHESPAAVSSGDQPRGNDGELIYEFCNHNDYNVGISAYHEVGPEYLEPPWALFRNKCVQCEYPFAKAAECREDDCGRPFALVNSKVSAYVCSGQSKSLCRFALCSSCFWHRHDMYSSKRRSRRSRHAAKL